MSNFTLADPKGWDCDLQSVYSAYMGHFQLHSIPWFDRSWGVFFESFEEFLTFSWPTITVTDTWTGRAHIVVRLSTVGAFLKMLKTRFGETLPMVDNILRVSPFETAQRHLRTISDYATYRKIHATLPAVALSALKVHVRSGEPKAIRELWAAKDKTFLALDLEWSERNTASCIEWGYAAVRCGHLDTAGAWPPDPEPNYRRGHYIVSEYADKVHNRMKPSFPWAYAFGDSQVIPKAKLSQVVHALLSSLMSPDSETTPNTLVLVAHGTAGDLRRLEEMKIKLPHNLLVVDTMAFERHLYATGQRGAMQEPSGRAREPGTPLALSALLQSLGADALACVPHNAGNAAFSTLLGLQLLLAPETAMPTPKVSAAMKRAAGMGMGAGMGVGMGMGRSPSVPPVIAFMPPMSVYPAMGVPYGSSPVLAPFPAGLTPEAYAHAEHMNGNGHGNGNGHRASSYFPSHRPGSAGHRLSGGDSPSPSHAQAGRMLGRARVSSMNDLGRMGNGSSTSVNELGEQMGSLHVKSRTVDSRGLPQSR